MTHHRFPILALLLGMSCALVAPLDTFSQTPNVDPPTTIRSTSQIKQNCANCHTLHGFFPLKEDPLNPGTMINANALCQSCHDPDAQAVPSQYYATAHTSWKTTSNYPKDPNDPNSGNYRVECLGCHNPHHILLNLRGVTPGFELATDATDPRRPTNDSPTSTNDQIDCSDINTLDPELCRNFKLLGTTRDDTGGARTLTPGISDTEANCTATAQANSNNTNSVEDDASAIPVYDGNNNYLGCSRRIVAGRSIPLIYGSGSRTNKSYYSDWSSASAPFQGICNRCHTRTPRHRNNNADTGLDLAAANINHNLNQRCSSSNCHNHSNGFSKGK